MALCLCWTSEPHPGVLPIKLTLSQASLSVGSDITVGAGIFSQHRKPAPSTWRAEVLPESCLAVSALPWALNPGAYDGTGGPVWGPCCLPTLQATLRVREDHGFVLIKSPGAACEPRQPLLVLRRCFLGPVW